MTPLRKLACEALSVNLEAEIGSFGHETSGFGVGWSVSIFGFFSVKNVWRMIRGLSAFSPTLFEISVRSVSLSSPWSRLKITGSFLGLGIARVGDIDFDGSEERSIGVNRSNQ